MSLVDSGSAKRCRDQRLRTFWRQEHLSMKMAVETTTHHTYYTNGVMEETVGHGPAGANEAYLPVRANVTRRHADTYTAPIIAVVVTYPMGTWCLPCPSASSRKKLFVGPGQETEFQTLTSMSQRG